MSFAGDYKVSSMKRLKADESGFEDVAAEVLIAQAEKDGDEQELRLFNTLISITEEGELLYYMPIPEDAPAEEIEKATKAGRIVDGKFIIDRQVAKIEDGNLYIQDTKKFLTGEEWVKINTENEGELDLVMMKYRKI